MGLRLWYVKIPAAPSIGRLQQLTNLLNKNPTQLTLHTEFSNQRTCKGTPSRFPGTKVQMAGSEPLIQEADPHITKACNRSSDVDKDGPTTKKDPV